MTSTSRFKWVAWVTRLRGIAALTVIVALTVFGYLKYQKFEQEALRYRRLAVLCAKKQRIYDSYVGLPE